MGIVLAALLLSAAQPVPVPQAVEPLEPDGCGAYMNVLQFESGSSRLSRNHRLILDFLVRHVLSRPYRSGVRLTGGTDRVGSRRANLALARQRALAVRAYLIAAGIPPARIHLTVLPETEGMGGPDGAAEPWERRVEILEDVPIEIIDRHNAWIRIHGPRRGPIC